MIEKALIMCIKGEFYNNAFKTGVKFIETRKQVIRNTKGKTYQKIGETVYFYNSDTKQVEYKGKLANIKNDYKLLTDLEKDNVNKYGLHNNLFFIFEDIEVLEKPLKPAKVYPSLFTTTNLTEMEAEL